MKNIILIVLMAVFSYAQSTFSDPQPTFEKPRKIVINIHDNDLETVNHNIGTIYNILKEYPSETLKVAVVLYGKGMRVIKKDYNAATLNRIKSLMEYDVEFIGCKNTMETMKWTQDDFISGVNYVQAGIVEVIERQNDGYFGITPY
jgi:intracellular sulfur oxidation DsrE/DsrF family protein